MPQDVPVVDLLVLTSRGARGTDQVSRLRQTAQPAGPFEAAHAHDAPHVARPYPSHAGPLSWIGPSGRKRGLGGMLGSRRVPHRARSLFRADRYRLKLVIVMTWRSARLTVDSCCRYFRRTGFTPDEFRSCSFLSLF